MSTEYIDFNKSKVHKTLYNFVNSEVLSSLKVSEKEFWNGLISAANEILVDQFLKKKLPFLAIFKTIMAILRDRNYKKYAIKVPNNLRQINNINSWAKKRTLEIIKSKYA